MGSTNCVAIMPGADDVWNLFSFRIALFVREPPQGIYGLGEIVWGRKSYVIDILKNGS